MSYAVTDSCTSEEINVMLLIGLVRLVVLFHSVVLVRTPTVANTAYPPRPPVFPDSEKRRRVAPPNLTQMFGHQ